MSYLLALFLLILSACGGNKPSYKVGIDPHFYPPSWQGREANIYGFTNDLLLEVAKLKKITFFPIETNTDNLIPHLKQNKYDAIFSSMQPHLFNEKDFDFSIVYLKTGPVLVVPEKSRVDSLSELKGKEVAVQKDSSGALILEKYPNILIRYYDLDAKALSDILTQTVDAAVLDALTAASYTHDIYQGELKVATEPLNEDGVRLITLHNTSKRLIKDFNSTLLILKKNGTYKKLLQKWNLSPD